MEPIGQTEQATNVDNLTTQDAHGEAPSHGENHDSREPGAHGTFAGGHGGVKRRRDFELLDTSPSFEALVKAGLTCRRRGELKTEDSGPQAAHLLTYKGLPHKFKPSKLKQWLQRRVFDKGDSRRQLRSSMKLSRVISAWTVYVAQQRARKASEVPDDGPAATKAYGWQCLVDEREDEEFFFPRRSWSCLQGPSLYGMRATRLQSRHTG